jgi:methyl-accepting chemotaxis protein
MFSKLSLAAKINVALLLIAIAFLSTTVIFFYYDEKKLSENFVERNLESLALNYFDLVNILMLTGTVADRQLIQNKILGAVKVTHDLSSVNQQIVKSITQAGILQLIITILSFWLLSISIKSLIFRGLRRTINDVERNLDLNKEIKVHHEDELGAVSVALNRMMKKFRGSFLSISSATDKLIDSATSVDEISNLTREALLNQKNGTDSVAAAINELDTSASEVYRNTQRSS